MSKPNPSSLSTAVRNKLIRILPRPVREAIIKGMDEANRIGWISDSNLCSHRFNMTELGIWEMHYLKPHWKGDGSGATLDCVAMSMLDEDTIAAATQMMSIKPASLRRHLFALLAFQIYAFREKPTPVDPWCEIPTRSCPVEE